MQTQYNREDLEKIDFSTSKNYSWKAEEEFIFNGKEFEFLFNEILGFINNPISVPSMVKLMNVYSLLETKFKIAILEDKIHEKSKVSPPVHEDAIIVPE